MILPLMCRGLSSKVTLDNEILEESDFPGER